MLIANPIRFVRDALHEAIGEEPDFEVLGDIGDEEAIAIVADRLKPDCLIIALDRPGAPPEVCRQVLGSNPAIVVIALGKGPEMLAIYWKSAEGPIRCTYGTASREGILRALRFSPS